MGSYFTRNSPPPRRIIHKESHHQHSETHALNYIALIVLSVVSVVILVIVLLLLLILCREKGKGNGCRSVGSSFRMGSYDKSKQVFKRSSDVKVNGIGHSSVERKRGQVFTYKELETATNGFSGKNVIGNGRNGVVYKGLLSEGTMAAIKLLHVEGKQGEREFRMEVDLLTRLHSHYLVDLLGYCADQHHRLLVFEYMPNGCLQQHLHTTISQVDKPFRLLDWRNRLRIALDCARALEFLHEHLVPSVIHGDFKSRNILLDHNFGAKVSGFGMEKTCSTGYIAPEYESTGKLTTKSDVYSFGVVLLELLTGRVPVDASRPRGEHVLVSWALPRLTNREKVVEMVDPALQGQYSRKELIQVAAIVAVCIQSEADYRPLISDVVQSLIPLVKSKSTTLSDTPAKFKDDQVSIMMP